MPVPHDDRDQPCAVARLTNRQLAWRALGIKSLTKDELVKQEQQATINTEVAISLIAGVLGWGVWVVAILPFTGLKNTYTGHLIVPFFFCIIVSTSAWYLSLSWVRRLKSARLAQIHLNHGLCPACAYTLKGLETQQDGCVVCPECSAAWKADRLSQHPSDSHDD